MRTTCSLPLETLLPGVQDEPATADPLVISGRDAVLRMLPRLSALAERCCQPNLPASMDHFLDSHYVGAKSPHLLLFGTGQGGSVSGAVLVHQYRLAGVALRLFVTEDVHGERNVLAPAALRSQVAVQATAYLMRKRRAHLAIVSLRDGRFCASPEAPCALVRQRWASATRASQRYLVLGSSCDETLASLGSHTRRNLRSAARKAERDLGCSFVPRVEISLSEFLELNARCAYPVTPAVARWRYRCAREAADAVTMGMRTREGQWLSLVGGRRSHGTMAVDWQMNPTELHRYSPSTVMRAHIIQHEHALGTAQILFEGGTPHTMSESLRMDTVSDLIAVSGQVPLRILQRGIAPYLPTYNVLRQTLEQPLLWHAGMATAWPIEQACSRPVGVREPGLLAMPVL